MYPYAGVAIRNKVCYFFRPLYKTVIARVKVFFIAHIQGFALVFQPVKIKVINRAVLTFVFIYYRKCRAGNRIANAQLFAKRFDERGFPCAHVAIKKEYAGIAGKV